MFTERTRSIVLTLCCLLSAFSPALGRGRPPTPPGGGVAPIVTSATIDFTANTLVITGSNFGSVPPTVTLAGTALNVVSFDAVAQQIVASLPAPTPVGTFLLVVAAAANPVQSGSFDLTIGPQGPKGDVGPGERSARALG